VAPDGAFGPATQEACAACSPPDAVAQYCSVREALYRRFAEAHGQDRFLAGWLNRLHVEEVRPSTRGLLPAWLPPRSLNWVGSSWKTKVRATPKSPKRVDMVKDGRAANA
jgi:hypothetical protein